MPSKTCIFCDIAHKLAPAHILYEDKDHIAFLNIFQNTSGCTLVITKEHFPSYVFDLPDEIRTELIRISKIVAGKLDRAFEDVGRTALVFEGFGVDHIHAKLYPLHGSKMESWRPILSINCTFSEKYLGFVSTHDGPRANDFDLLELAKRIRAA